MLSGVCVCVQGGRPRRQSQQHEAMERDDQGQADHDLYTNHSNDASATEHEMQTFSAPHQMRHLHDSDDEVDSHDRSDLGVMDQRSGVTEYDELVSRDSSMDATSIDTARKHYLARAHRQDCISNPSAINYFPYPSESGSCTTEDYALSGGGGSLRGSEEDGRSRVSTVEVHSPPPHSTSQHMPPGLTGIEGGQSASGPATSCHSDQCSDSGSAGPDMCTGDTSVTEVATDCNSATEADTLSASMDTLSEPPSDAHTPGLTEVDSSDTHGHHTGNTMQPDTLLLEQAGQEEATRGSHSPAKDDNRGGHSFEEEAGMCTHSSVDESAGSSTDEVGEREQLDDGAVSR